MEMRHLAPCKGREAAEDGTGRGGTTPRPEIQAQVWMNFSSG